MRTIPLTGKRGQGLFAIVDDHNYEKLSKHKWTTNGFGYAVANIGHGRKDRSMILMHNMIMPDKDGLELDHKNRNRIHNYEDNFRYVTRSQNNMNRSKNKKSPSKYKGVSFELIRRYKLADGSYGEYEPVKKYKAQISMQGIKHRMKRFATENEAAHQYNIWAKELFGEFANLNIITT